MSQKATPLPFCVLDRVQCVWTWQPEEDNLTFLNGVDGQYFEYVAAAHFEELEGENKQRAAAAIKLNYHLSLETLFSFVGAMLQSPRAISAWLLKSNTSDIRAVAQSVLSGGFDYPLGWSGISPKMDSKHISAMVLQYTTWASDPEDNTISNFADVLLRFAGEYLEPNSITEFNSMKHGFRARSGGFSLRMGRETTYGVAAAEKDMQFVGASKFGSSFPSVVDLSSAAKTEKSLHFRLVDKSLNWSPSHLVQRTQLVSFFIKNIVNACRFPIRKPNQEISFERPEFSEGFRDPWKDRLGVYSTSLSLVLDKENITHYTRSQIREVMKNVTSKAKTTKTKKESATKSS